MLFTNLLDRGNNGDYSDNEFTKHRRSYIVLSQNFMSWLLNYNAWEAVMVLNMGKVYYGNGYAFIGLNTRLYVL